MIIDQHALGCSFLGFFVSFVHYPKVLPEFQVPVLEQLRIRLNQNSLAHALIG